MSVSMLHSRGGAAVPALGEPCARHRAAPAPRPSVQKQLQGQARCRLAGSSTLYVAGRNGLQSAVQQAARGGSRHVQARCVMVPRTSHTTRVAALLAAVPVARPAQRRCRHLRALRSPPRRRVSVASPPSLQLA